MSHLTGTNFFPPCAFTLSDEDASLHKKIRRQREGNEAISVAIEADDVDAFEKIVAESGIDSNKYFLERGADCLKTAIESGSTQVTQFLLTQPPRDIVESLVNQRPSGGGCVAILEACDTETENLELVNSLLKAGARVETPQPLAAAAARGHMRIVRVLMKLTPHDDRGLAVKLAVKSDRIDIVKELVHYQVMNVLDRELRTVAPRVKAFVNENKYGEDLNESLRLAVVAGNQEIVQVLLKAGACGGKLSAVSGMAKCRLEALADAAISGHVDRVKVLLTFSRLYVDNSHLGSILIDAIHKNQHQTASQIVNCFDASIILSRVLYRSSRDLQKTGKAVKFLMDRNPDLSRALDHTVRNEGDPYALLLLGAPGCHILVSAARSNDAVRVKQAVLCEETATQALIQLAKAQETAAANFLVTQASAHASAAAALIILALCGDTAALPVLAPLADADAAYEKFASSGNSDAIHMLVSTGLAIPEQLLERLLKKGDVAAVRTLIKCNAPSAKLMHTLYDRYQSGDAASRQSVQLLLAYGADASLLPSEVVEQLTLEIEAQRAEFFGLSAKDKVEYFEDIAYQKDAIGLALMLDHEVGLDALRMVIDAQGLYTTAKQTLRDYIVQACTPTSDEIEALLEAGKLAFVQTFAHSDVLAQLLIRHIKDRDEEAVRELMTTLTDGGSALAAAAMNDDSQLLSRLFELGADGPEAMWLLLRGREPLFESASRLIARGVDINAALTHILDTRENSWEGGDCELRMIGAVAEAGHEDNLLDTDDEDYF